MRSYFLVITHFCLMRSQFTAVTQNCLMRSQFHIVTHICLMGSKSTFVTHYCFMRSQCPVSTLAGLRGLQFHYNMRSVSCFKTLLLNEIPYSFQNIPWLNQFPDVIRVLPQGTVISFCKPVKTMSCDLITQSMSQQGHVISLNTR